MSAAGKVAPKAIMLEYTNKLLPNKKDATWLIVAKVALIALTAGLALAVTATIDLTKKGISSIKSLFKKEEATQEKASEKPTLTKEEATQEKASEDPTLTKEKASEEPTFKKEEATQEKASEEPTLTKKEKTREIADDFIKAAKESLGNAYLIPNKTAKVAVSMRLKASGISGFIFGKAALFAGIGYIGARNGALAAIGAGLAGTFSHSIYSYLNNDSN